MAEEHPIRVVARRTGLSPHVIRVWEKRYQAISPKRTVTNRRFYTNAEIDRLNLLRRATQAGRNIGQVAALTNEQLQELLRVDESAGRQTRKSFSLISAQSSLDEYVQDCLKAARDMDGAGLEASLVRGSIHLSPFIFLERVITPLMSKIGELWKAGDLSVAHEHLASEIVRTILGSMMSGRPMTFDTPNIIITAPFGQFHEFGALMASIIASTQGWRVTYMGSNLPATEIARAAEYQKSSAVALSIVYAADDAKIGIELQRLRKLMGSIRIFCGGRAAEFYQNTLQSIDAAFVKDLNDFQAQLESFHRKQ